LETFRIQKSDNKKVEDGSTAVANQGIALLPTFIVGEALQNTELRTILNDFAPPATNLRALYPRHRHLSSKVRLFVDALEERFGGRPHGELVH